jgi:hypothetical protein
LQETGYDGEIREMAGEADKVDRNATRSLDEIVAAGLALPFRSVGDFAG